jgi:hypothetical protein
LSLSIVYCQSGGDDATGEGGSVNAGGSATAGSGGATGGSNTGAGGAGGSSSGGGGSQAGSGGSAGAGLDAGRGGSGGAGGAGGTGGSAGSGGSSTDGGAVPTDGGAGGRDAQRDANTASDAGGDAPLPYNPCPPIGQPCKILPLGDSITDGFTVLGGYRIELFRAAHAAGQSITFVGSLMNGPAMVDGVNFPRSHEGHNGFTIADEQAAGRMGISGQLTATAMTNFTPHIVTLAIGTNDVDLNVADLATANVRLGALMDQIFNANPSVLLVVAQIVPTGTDAENVRVRAYNATIPPLVQARADAGRHIMLVDMYTAFTNDPNFRTTLLADNLHPNMAGYTVMGQVWYRALSNLFH